MKSNYYNLRMHVLKKHKKIKSHTVRTVLTMDKHLTQLVFGPEIVRIRSKVKIASSLFVMLIFAPDSKARVRIVIPPRPERERKM